MQYSKVATRKFISITSLNFSRVSLVHYTIPLLTYSLAERGRKFGNIFIQLGPNFSALIHCLILTSEVDFADLKGKISVLISTSKLNGKFDRSLLQQSSTEETMFRFPQCARKYLKFLCCWTPSCLLPASAVVEFV